MEDERRERTVDFDSRTESEREGSEHCFRKVELAGILPPHRAVVAYKLIDGDDSINLWGLKARVSELEGQFERSISVRALIQSPIDLPS